MGTIFAVLFCTVYESPRCVLRPFIDEKSLRSVLTDRVEVWSGSRVSLIVVLSLMYRARPVGTDLAPYYARTCQPLSAPTARPKTRAGSARGAHTSTHSHAHATLACMAPVLWDTRVSPCVCVILLSL